MDNKKNIIFTFSFIIPSNLRKRMELKVKNTLPIKIRSYIVKDGSESQSSGKKKHPKVLLTITTIYGIIYVTLILSFLLFENPNYNNITLEGVIVSLAFIVFLIGYYFSWKNEMIAGLIFLFWWGMMWYLGLFVAERDRGAGVVMGVPMFIIGILFIVYWYRRRVTTNNS